jgi:hypothetical protein
LLLLFSFTSLLTPHKTLVNTHKINKCAKFGSILLGVSREDDENIVSHRVSSMWSPRRLGHMFLTIPFNMFYYIVLKYGNFLLETLDTFPLLKDAYTQSRKLYPSWYGALQQILNNIHKWSF